VLLAVWKLAPALLAGNTVVLKPSPLTPLTTLRLGELCRELLPPGVVNVISGGDDLGRRIVRHRVPRKITFTGSVSAGRSVAAAAGESIKRLTLELGGNDAALLLPGIDAGSVADDLIHAAFINSGQACNAVKRLYVHERDHAAVVEAVAERAAALRVGDGLDEDCDLGPLINEAQLLRVAALVDNARAGGGTVVTGGRRLTRRGFFFAPTVVTGLEAGDRLVEEEQFGPVLPVIAYRDVDRAVDEINAGPFGLCGSVWSSDLEAATAVATRLDCGSAWVNQHLAMGPHLPFGGSKFSGIGTENGIAGLLEYTQLQVLNVRRR
jgi:acyl-CoA reductase-like NAD-dependent aldehyde dehydrogenase